jgi:nucleotide-binding universal stress UspA family protein
MTRVLIAMDGTNCSKRAAEAAVRLFPQADLLAVNVAGAGAPWAGAYAWGAVGAFPFPAPSAPMIDDAALAAAAAGESEEVVETARDAGVDEVESVEGTDAAEAILRAAHEHEADVVVVGRHDKGWFARLLEGSVSSGILKGAEIPVLVVH